VIADRFDKRTILFVVQGLSFAVSGTIGLLIATGHVEVWHLYLQVAAQSGLAAVDAATRQAMFPTLVPRAHLVEAVTLQSTAARSAGLIGPAIGGFVIAGLGEAAPFLVNGATSLVLILALAAMRDVPSEAAERRSFRADLAEGFHYLWRSPTLRGLLQMEFVFSLFRINPVIVTIIASERLRVGPEGVGGLLAAEGVGAVVGVAALVAIGSPRRPGRYVILGTVAYAASLVVFAVAGAYAIAFAALVISGFWDASIMVTRNSVMQLEAPGRMRGRVMANLGMVSRGTAPLSQTQSGLLVEAVGAPLALVAAAVALSTNAVGTAATNPVLRAFSTTTAVEAEHVAEPEDTAPG